MANEDFLDVLVKICGVTNQEDADACVEQRANLIGFIFHPESRRNVAPSVVADIDTGPIMRVGVFVNQSVEEVRKIMKAAELHLAQLHGDQDKDFCERVGKTKVMRAFWPERHMTPSGQDGLETAREDLEKELNAFADATRFHLLDAGTSGGGHGLSMDFCALAGLAAPKTWFLAGGIGPHNLRQALESCNPCGVDISSGVEREPGRKDHELLRHVFKIIRGE